MRYSKKQSERVHYVKLSNFKPNIRVTRKYIIAAVVTSIVLMFFSACLWRLLRHAPKIKCETCMTLTTVSPENNSNTALPQSRDLIMLSTLQVSKHTPTLQNVVMQHGKYFSHVHKTSFFIFFLQHLFLTLYKLKKVHLKKSALHFTQFYLSHSCANHENIWSAPLQIQL
jgi:hypothetical protein